MIKKLVSCVGEYKKASILPPLFVTMEGVMEVIIPLLMVHLIDNGINQGNMAVVYKTGILLIVTTLVSLLFGVLSGHFAAVASAGFAKNLRRKMYYKIQDFSFFNLDHYSTASLVTRLTTDVTNVQQAFQMVIRLAVRSPVLLLFSLIMSVSINPKLSLIFFCVIPFLGFGLYSLIIHVHPIFERVFRTYDQLN
ncbi:MAG TPA: ABC transporter permease, partial [Bacillota bacterium]|nr:ABC transporter permease [Bacillota bacterium]